MSKRIQNVLFLSTSDATSTVPTDLHLVGMIDISKWFTHRKCNCTAETSRLLLKVPKVMKDAETKAVSNFAKKTGNNDQ